MAEPCHKCCRGRPLRTGNATLWKIRLSDGALMWAADRGSTSTAIHVCDEGGDTMIYEGGGLAAGKSLTKWRDDGVGGEKLWTFVKSTLQIEEIAKTPGDNVIWLSHDSSTTVTRITEGGSEINSAAVAVPGMSLAPTSATSCGAYRFNVANAGAYIYDTAISLVTSKLIASSAEVIAPRDEPLHPSCALGWIHDDDTGGGTQLVTYDQDLNETGRTATLATSTIGTQSQNRVQLSSIYDLASLTSVFSLLAGGQVVTRSSDNSTYVRETTQIRRYNAAGSSLWTRSIDSVPANAFLAVAPGRVLWSGTGAGGTVDVDASTDNYRIASFADSDGHLEWGVRYPRVFTPRALQVFGDYVYVCGTRVISSS